MEGRPWQRGGRGDQGDRGDRGRPWHGGAPGLRRDRAIQVHVAHPGGNPGEYLKSISQRYYRREVAFAWELA